MGYHDYEEWHAERGAEIEAEKDQYLNDSVWVSSEGVETPVKELETDHLNAIIKWINYNGFHREEEWLEILEEEAERRTKDMFDNMDDNDG